MAHHPAVIEAETGPVSKDDRSTRLRNAMVDRLQGRVIRDARIEEAFRTVPRHVFLPGVDVDKVYGGAAIPTRFDEKKRPISSSSEVEIMTVMAEQLELAPGMHVLEIGAGTGYNAAILSELVGSDGRVTTIDIDPEISSGARAHLAAAGRSGVTVVTGDGWQGVPDDAPYDRIELTASTGDLSPSWIEQLAEGGILVVPLWLRGGWQFIVAFRKREGLLSSTSVRGGGFMPLRGAGALADPAVSRDGRRVVGAGATDVDAIFGLLSSEPRIVLGPGYDPERSWDRMTALAASAADLIGVTAHGKGFALGLYDARSNGLAVATFSSISHLGPRIVYAVHGGEGSLPTLRTLVETGPKTCAEIAIHAEPLTTPLIEGGIVRRHYRPVVHRLTPQALG